MPGTAAVAAWSDTAFRAMGSRARVLVLGGPAGLPARAREHVEDLEARWSRFRPESELCRLNAAAGRPVLVSPATFSLIRLAVDAWHRTGGRFDPTVLDALTHAGYDRDFDALSGARVDPLDPADPPETLVPGCAGVVLDPLVGSVTLPAGTHLDLGGIGKGAAADAVATDLLAAGAAGACVDLGGDVRVAGEGPEAGAWRVVVDPELAPGWHLDLAAGAVATSSRLRRRWYRHGKEVHHLLDPATGAPARTGLRAVTVLASTAAWAEVLAKAVFVAGPGPGAELLRDASVHGLLVHDDGSVEPVAGIEAFRA
jgi:thiamine biosynthesis lipoprotein